MNAFYFWTSVVVVVGIGILLMLTTEPSIVAP